MLQKKFLKYIFIFFALGVFFPKYSVFASINLVKTKESPAIYYLNGEKSRHVFPNEITYKSWYENDYSKVAIVSKEYISKIPLGKNITLRPGKFLIKVPSDPKVYTVEVGGVLRPLADEIIAEEFFGEQWKKKVVDIPEVFFDNYTVSDPIQKSYDVPNGVIYKVEGESKFYWKVDDILRLFADESALTANGYLPQDALTNKRGYYVRTRPIIGFDESVSNPISLPRKKVKDCENKSIKAALILVSKDSHTFEEVNTLTYIQKNFSEYFSRRMNSLSSIDLSYSPIVLKDDGYLIKKSKNNSLELVLEEVGSAFFKDNPDVFDFFIVFSNFDSLPTNEQGHFIPVSNHVEGIGKPTLEGAHLYGSLGKLKGLALMGNVNNYSVLDDKNMNQMMNVLMHEILHQWSGSVTFIDASGTRSDELLRKPDLVHWNFFVDFFSPLGGAGWQDNSNGTFTSLSSQIEDSRNQTLPDIDLYLMGLLPYQYVKPFYYIIPRDPLAKGNTISGEKKKVTIDQIIAANGKWACRTR